VTSQGSPHGRFQRAIERRLVFRAEIAARELGFLSLQNALALVVLYAQEDSPKFEPAAVTWLARLALEGKDMRLTTSNSPPERSRACVGRDASGPRRRCSACSRLRAAASRTPWPSVGIGCPRQPLPMEALMKAVHCPCGEVFEAETDDELVEKVQQHVREDHPELEGEYTREKILSIAHDH
jgi:predicted small metal-binding protein